MFTDEIHIEELRRKLWTGGETGRAAVMVGAGFSRFADPVGVDADPLPLWADLGERLYRQVHASHPNATHGRGVILQEAAKIGYLRLASQFECAFGRSTLDQRLKSWTADDSHRPGALHRLLLQLPWSDVFTTNYDRLLERAARQITDKKYDLVQAPSDLPGVGKPRIVKLHGSFPSERPFVLTEEDYRRYPRDSAPFVNTVQQSLMENAFCLLGFSGTDPNFNYWTGWVRDNLGDATPKLYLVGLLDLSDPERQLLERRHVVPIDLSQRFPRQEGQDPSIRYRQATEWFLYSLLVAKPSDPITWGTDPEPAPHTPSLDLRKPLPNAHVSHRQPSSPRHPPSKRPAPSDFEQLVQDWAGLRNEYPGWLVAPREIRDRIWRTTWEWAPLVLSNVLELPAPLDLHILYELTWRMDTALMPLLTDWRTVASEIVGRYNPFPSSIEISTATWKHDGTTVDFSWHSVADHWTELAFWLMRVYRQHVEFEPFREWRTRMEALKGVLPDALVRVSYEAALFSLFALDFVGLRKVLDEWPKGDPTPLWQLRRASLLAEVGEVDDAKLNADDALNNIREAVRIETRERAALSQEGWGMFLARLFGDCRIGRHDTPPEYRERWQHLEAYHCNPWTEFQLLRKELEFDAPALLRSDVETRPGFDPGKRTRSRSFRTGPRFEERRAAFEFLEIYERVGVPYRCGDTVVFTDSIGSASRWIYPFAHRRSMAALLRSGHERSVDDLLDRVRIATMPDEDVMIWFEQLLAVLKAVPRLSHRRHHAEYQPRSTQVRIATDVASRLAFRLPANELKRLLDVAIEHLQPGQFSGEPGLGRYLVSLFERVLAAAPLDMVAKVLLLLLEAPVPDDAFVPAIAFDWPEPFAELINGPPVRPRDGFKSQRWQSAIANLLRIGRHGREEARKRATLRLAALSLWDLLEDEEASEFAEVLWIRVDGDTGLPEQTNLRHHVFALLPHPDALEPTALLRAALVENPIPNVVRRSKELGKPARSAVRPQDAQANWRYFESLLFGSVRCPFPNAGEQKTLIRWSASDAAVLARKMAGWMSDETESFGDWTLADLDDYADNFRFAAKVLGEVIVPCVEPADEDAVAAVLKTLEDFDTLGVRTEGVWCMTLRLAPDREDNLVARLRSALSAGDREAETAALQAVHNWVICREAANLPEVPQELIDEIVNKVAQRTGAALDVALWAATGLAKQANESLGEAGVGRLVLGLRYLLEETSLPSDTEREVLETKRLVNPIDERPLLRQRSAELAGALEPICRKSHQQGLGVIEQWRQAALASTLPEVRRVWTEL